MSDFLTLAYLDFHQLLHRVQTIFRQPGRALVYVLVAGYFVMIQMLRSHTRVPVVAVAVPEPFASAIMFSFVALIGVITYGAASGFVGVFSSAADARFLCGSQLPEPTVVMWLQLRRCASMVLRTALAILLYAFVPHAVNFASTGLVGFTVIAGTLFTAATAVPMLKLRATVGSRFARTFAAAIVAAGLLPLAILLDSLLNSGLAPWAHAIQSIGAGYAINALFHGSAAGLTSFYAAAGAMLFLSYVTGRDLYPELYASSLRVQAFRLRRRRPDFIATERAYKSSGPLAPSRIFEGARGAWTIAWKEWIAFMRAPGARRMFWLGLFGCAIAGAIFGNIARHSRNPLETALLLGSSVANMVIIFITIASSFGLAEDLRKPMWWMGRDPIWLRLLAWVLATSWRLSICIAIGTVVFAATLGLSVVAATGIPIAITIAVYLRSIGLALYALLPSGLDQRGPLAMLRALLTYLFALPGIGATVLAALLTHSLAVAVAAGIIVALGEALGLIAFAAARIQGRGATFAQAEAA
jgi:hypothetical protein